MKTIKKVKNWAFKEMLKKIETYEKCFTEMSKLNKETYDNYQDVMNKYDTLKSQNKALQEANSKLKAEKNLIDVICQDHLRTIEKLKEQLGLADFTVAKLKTKLSKFKDLKKEVDRVSSGIDVWIAMEENGESNMFSGKPEYHNEEGFVTGNKFYGKPPSRGDKVCYLGSIEQFIPIEPLQCKKYILNEAKD